MKTIKERVAAGARWLDKHEPGWADQIDGTALRMENSRMCVLGQVYGSFHGDAAGRATYRVSVPLGRKYAIGFGDVAADRGFNAHSNYAIMHEYMLLEQEWQRVIKARQSVKEEVNA